MSGKREDGTAPDESQASAPRKRALDALLGVTRAERFAAIAAFALLGVALFLAFRAVDAWAARTFARPILASALVAVCDVALFAVALCVAPALSKAIHLLARRASARKTW